MIFRLFIICLTLTAFCDLAKAHEPPSDSTEESTYIRSFKDYFYVKGLYTRKFLNLEFVPKVDGGSKLEYLPSVNGYNGFGIYVFDLGLELSFKLPDDDKNTAIYGKTRITDFQANMYSRKFGLDLIYQRYQGFYINNPDHFFPKWKSGDPYPFRHDLIASTISVGFNYVFRSDEFSFPSAFNHSEQQVRSSGSFILSGISNRSELNADSSIIPTQAFLDFGPEVGLTSVRVTTFSVLPGYSHNIIIQNFYVNLALSLGPGFQMREYDLNERRVESTKLEPFFKWRLGMGYNSKRFFTGVSFHLQQESSDLDVVTINASTGNIKFFFGYRFPEFGILKKSIFDLPLLQKRTRR